MTSLVAPLSNKRKIKDVIMTSRYYHVTSRSPSLMESIYHIPVLEYSTNFQSFMSTTDRKALRTGDPYASDHEYDECKIIMARLVPIFMYSVVFSFNILLYLLTVAYPGRGPRE